VYCNLTYIENLDFSPSTLATSCGTPGQVGCWRVTRHLVRTKIMYQEILTADQPSKPARWRPSVLFLQRETAVFTGLLLLGPGLER
jgi:hypothetical protein